MKIGKEIVTCENECEECFNCINDELDARFKKKSVTGYWLIIGRNTDWRGRNGYMCKQAESRNGYMYKQAETGGDLISTCINGYGDVHLTIKNYGKGFYLNAKHHDCPVNGTSFYCIPVSRKTYEKEPYVEV